MVRVLRLSSIFRSIIKRSDEVLPAIVGPLALVLSSMHVYTYSGMAIWGGAVSVGMHSDMIAPLYDLMNFNNYLSGLLTMFNIFVVNDWQAIAGVYLTADRCSSPYIVYPFFIGANLVGVDILLNVLTAFFVGAFVTKVENKSLGVTSDLHLSMSSTRLDAGSRNFANLTDRAEASIYGFHVVERQGYDSVMSTITGDEGTLDMAKKACELLETFDRLSPRENQVGYLVCYQESPNYFGNQHFLSLIRGYIEDDDLHNVVAEMFSTSSARGDGAEIKRVYRSTDDSSTLVLSAALCCRSPTMALIVAKKVY